MSRHTPGPWESLGGMIVRQTDPEYNEYVKVDVETPANARLIAAAPLLLDALQMAKHIVANEGNDEQMAQVFAAIEAATGEPA